MHAGPEEHATEPREIVDDLPTLRARLLALLDDRRRRSRRGCNHPPPTVGWELVEAGYRSLRELAAAIPISHEVLSNVRGGAYPLGPKLRARIAELLDIHEDWVLVALRRKPGPRWRW